MKYVFIEKHQAEFSIQAMCRVPTAAGICGIGGGQG
ncbi:transposase [Escherichia coli TA271]|nr:transposase [Escherichia coli TA271]